MVKTNSVTFRTNPFIINTNPVKILTIPVIFRTYPVIFGTNPVIFRINLVIIRTNPEILSTHLVIFGINPPTFMTYPFQIQHMSSSLLIFANHQKKKGQLGTPYPKPRVTNNRSTNRKTTTPVQSISRFFQYFP